MKVDGYRYGGDIAKWLSDYLQQENLDLVNCGPGLEPRKVILIDEKGNSARELDEILYNDYSPFMLISERSLDDLNSRLNQKVTLRHFRPTFAARDVADPYGEVILQIFAILCLDILC